MSLLLDLYVGMPCPMWISSGLLCAGPVLNEAIRTIIDALQFGQQIISPTEAET